MCEFSKTTFQVIALLHAVANNPHIGLTKFLIVAPLNTVYNWENEFEKWLEFDQRMDVSTDIFSVSGLIFFKKRPCYSYISFCIESRNMFKFCKNSFLTSIVIVFLASVIKFCL